MSDWVKRLCIIIKTRPKTILNSATERAQVYPSLLRTQRFTAVLVRKINSFVICSKSYIRGRDVHTAPSGKKYFKLVVSVLMTQFGELMTTFLSEICQITRNILASLNWLRFFFFLASKDEHSFLDPVQESQGFASLLDFNWKRAIICCYLLRAQCTSYHWVSCCPPTLPPVHLILSFPSACIITPLQSVGKEVIGFKCSWLTNLYLNTQLGTLCSQWSAWMFPILLMAPCVLILNVSFSPCYYFCLTLRRHIHKSMLLLRCS